MPSTAVSELQQKLFKRMGIDVPTQGQGQGRKNYAPRGSTKPLTRKLQRKAQRVQKKAQRYSSQPNSTPHSHSHSQGGAPRGGKNFQHSRHQPQRASSRLNETNDSEDDGQLSDEDEDVDHEEMDMGLDDPSSDEEGSDDEDESEPIDDEEEPPPKKLSGHNGLSRVVREKLAQDDAEIDELERKLGIKKGRSSLPKAFKEDGLDEIMGGLGGDISDSEDDETLKRKRDYDDWLASKRRKTNSKSLATQSDDAETMSENSQDDDNDDALDTSGEHDETGIDGQSFDGFGSDDEEADQPQKPKKENPYVAPTTGAVIAKYIPPSLRKTSGSESEARIRLQKQIQGLINRLTEANILSIVQSTEELYQNNARGDVTELLINTILAQMHKPESIPDQFFVLTGGFSAAIYKVIGSSFGSHLVRQVVKDFGDAYEKSGKQEGDSSAIRKESSNMIGFLTQLYLFEVVSCKIIFDYMERLLVDLSELNVELLLRICRMAGRLLRRDDPLALKHVTSILNKAVSQVGYANISARTKFMIETINDLKNSKPKARGMDSSIVSSHVLGMRKRLGELKSQSRRLDGLAPMGVGLHDIEKADTQGKWWLVGASVPAKENQQDVKNTSKTSGDDSMDLTDNEDMDFVLPDYPKKARSQGFNTAAQIGIFTAIMSATNYEHGYRQYVGLGLKKDDQLEIARVLVQCVGSEAQYNEYYVLVGRQACINSRVRFAFQNRLWRIFRGLGESMFGEEADDDDETIESERMKDERRISHVARFYAFLIADGALGISVLKPLNLPEMSSWTLLFVEWLMINLLRACRDKEVKENTKVGKVFGAAEELPSLAAGIHWFLRKKVRKTKLISAKEAKKLRQVREKVQVVVQGQAVAQD